MGSDDLFHKRKAKNNRELARKNGKRAVYDKVLIVCEGSKTEPYYFSDARNYHKLNTLNIHIEGTGKDPLSLVTHAKALYQEAERLGDAYDKVYCVFDKDQHSTYQQALDFISKLSPKSVWFEITSVPCFEYWLLLHFVYTSQPFYSVEGISSSQQAEEKLKTYMPNYSKGNKFIYSDLIGQINIAINHAKQIDLEATRNETDNPSTKIYELVEVIRNIK